MNNAKDSEILNSVKTNTKSKKQKDEEIYISFEDASYIDKINVIQEKLKEYIINNYDIDNDKISRKYIHTFKTKLVNDQIVESLKLNDRDKYISTIIALFHDYARFEQAKIYDSFNDLATVDHADLAVEKLFDKNEIANFVTDLTEEELEIVKLAIKNHNKYGIEQGLTEKQILFCKIIRDADKVDIFRVISCNFKYKEVPIGTLDEKDLENFYNHKLYKRTKEETFYTNVISNLSFFYDINFKKSYEIVYKNKYVNKYMCALLLAIPFKVQDEILNCFKYTENYIKEKATETQN